MRNSTEVIIDLGKELSLLHSYLEETWTQQVIIYTSFICVSSTHHVVFNSICASFLLMQKSKMFVIVW